MATAIHPSNVHGIPAPIRDDRALGPTEDLDRQPDGVPHDVIGLTFLFSIVLALLCGGIFMSGGVVGHIAGPLIALIAIPVIVMSLSKRAARERDPHHPAR